MSQVKDGKLFFNRSVQKRPPVWRLAVFRQESGLAGLHHPVKTVIGQIDMISGKYGFVGVKAFSAALIPDIGVSGRLCELYQPV